MSRPPSRYAPHLTDLLLELAVAAGAVGICIEDGEALMTTEAPKTVRTLLNRMGVVRRLHSAGLAGTRRWFATAEFAEEYEKNGRPRTRRAVEAAARAARAVDRDATRAIRLAKLAQPRGPQSWWSEAEKAILRAVYPIRGVAGVQESVNRSVASITSKALKLGIACEVCVQHLHPEKRASKGTKASLMPRRDLIGAGGAAPAPVAVKKARGPAHVDGPAAYHPNFKFTVCPSPGTALRTNTHSMF